MLMNDKALEFHADETACESNSNITTKTIFNSGPVMMWWEIAANAACLIM